MALAPCAAAGVGPGVGGSVTVVMSKPEARHLPALDGLRAVAVAAVVAFHLGRLQGGFLGVDVFFVVSGFLITRLLLGEWDEHGRIDGRAFWARRFRRLLPALLVVLAAVAVASRAWLPAWRLADIRDDALAALAYVANWRFVLSDQSYFARGIGPSPLRHTWSLAIEEQFYLLWPVLVLGALALARRRAPDARRVVGAVAAVGAVASAVWMAVAAGRPGGHRPQPRLLRHRHPGLRPPGRGLARHLVGPGHRPVPAQPSVRPSVARGRGPWPARSAWRRSACWRSPSARTR